MKIITSQASSFRPVQRTVLAPDSAPVIAHVEAKELIKAFGTFAGKNVSGSVVAGGAWKLTTVPHATTSQELSSILTNNNISAEKAPELAGDLKNLLSNPAVRSILFGVSGGAAAYLIVEKTSWSTRAKWTVTLCAGVLSGGLYLLLHHFRYVT